VCVGGGAYLIQNSLFETKNEADLIMKRTKALAHICSLSFPLPLHWLLKGRCVMLMAPGSWTVTGNRDTAGCQVALGRESHTPAVPKSHLFWASTANRMCVFSHSGFPLSFHGHQCRKALQRPQKETRSKPKRQKCEETQSLHLKRNL
jgi:hypothetical protein